MKAVLRSPILCVLMLAGAALAAALKPTSLLAEQRPGMDLERMVPKRFGEWNMVPLLTGQIVDPGQQAMIESLYAQTLTRTYVDKDGYMIMLSISYGRDQRDALQLHRPDICYPAQGFVLLEKQNAHLPGRKQLPVTQLQTRQGSRFEPVTYWTMIGDHPYAGNLNKKLAEIRYGLSGTIPDGMLVRVSSIDRDARAAHTKQSDFALAMITALPDDARSRFAGN